MLLLQPLPLVLFPQLALYLHEDVCQHFRHNGGPSLPSETQQVPAACTKPAGVCIEIMAESRASCMHTVSSSCIGLIYRQLGAIYCYYVFLC